MGRPRLQWRKAVKKAIGGPPALRPRLGRKINQFFLHHIAHLLIPHLLLGHEIAGRNPLYIFLGLLRIGGAHP